MGMRKEIEEGGYIDGFEVWEEEGHKLGSSLGRFDEQDFDGDAY